ncbi:unnamed protein product, partial [Tetraodon nigroviridis]
LSSRNNQLADLPAEMKNLGKLRSIVLNCNRFRSFPEVLYHMVSLETIMLGNNQVDGLDPSGLMRLRSLSTLDLSNNDVLKVSQSGRESFPCSSSSHRCQGNRCSDGVPAQPHPCVTPLQPRRRQPPISVPKRPHIKTTSPSPSCVSVLIPAQPLLSGPGSWFVRTPPGSWFLVNINSAGSWLIYTQQVPGSWSSTAELDSGVWKRSLVAGCRQEHLKGSGSIPAQRSRGELRFWEGPPPSAPGSSTTLSWVDLASCGQPEGSQQAHGPRTRTGLLHLLAEGGGAGQDGGGGCVST